MGRLFKDILGQKAAVKILSSQLKTGDLSHAYMFLGEEGSGKSHLAKEFSKNILCKNLEEKENCESCKNFQHGVHPDFIFVSGENGIKIEQIRESIERIYLSPALSDKKVLLITNAQNMGIESANAILKTIEEPPADSVVVLTAISERSLPETIISRVQRIKLLPLGTEDILQILQENCDEKKAEEVAFYAEGNIGEAKRLMNDEEALKNKQQLFEDVLKVLKSKSLIERFKIIEDHEKKKTLKDFFRVLGNIVSDGLKTNIQGGGQIDPELDLSREELVRLMEKILKIGEELEYNVSLRLALEEMILENNMASSKRRKNG